MTPPFLAVTLNPAIDRTVEVDKLRLGEVVRGRLVYVEPAGKGVNVSHSLSALGGSVVCTGFVGRGEAAFFNRGFKDTSVRPDFVRVQGATRVSVTILDRARDQETHITEQGFEVTTRDTKRLIAKVRDLASPEAWVLLNGRPAPGFGVEAYRDLLSAVRETGACVAVDTSGDYLQAAAEIGADFLKPNEEELAQLVGRKPRGTTAVVDAARGLTGSISRIVVSLGGRGAICVTRRKAWRARERRRASVVHTVGAGDALTSGFVFALAEGMSSPEALRLAVACGGACVRSPRAALRTRDEIETVLPNVEVHQL